MKHCNLKKVQDCNQLQRKQAVLQGLRKRAKKCNNIIEREHCKFLSQWLHSCNLPNLQCFLTAILLHFLSHFLGACNHACFLCYSLLYCTFCNLLLFLSVIQCLFLASNIDCILGYCLYSCQFSNLLCFPSAILCHFFARFLRACSITCFLCYCLHHCKFSNLHRFISKLTN